MKKITFFFLLLTVSLGYSQVVLEDFEGTAPTVTWSDDNGNATSAVSTAQSVSGTNSLELISTAAGAPWQGARLLMQTNKIDMRDATTGVGTNKTVTFQLYSTPAVRFLVKLSNGDADPAGTNPALESKTSVAHPGGGWALMTADFTVPADTGQPGYNPPTDQFSSILFFPLFATDGSDGWDVCCDANTGAVTTTYIDDVTAFAGDAIIPPTPNPAPSPLPTSINVETYSIYNDTNGYTTTFPYVYSFGSVAGEPDLDTGAGVNLHLKFDFNVAGYGVGEGGPDDVSAYNFVNFMYWAEPGIPGFQFRMISNNGGVVTEHTYEIGTNEPVVTGAWTQVSIPMSYFTGIGFSSTNFFQWKFDAFMQQIAQGGIVFVDNITLTTQVQPSLSVNAFSIAKFKAFPNPTNNYWNFTSTANINKVTVYNILGKQVISLLPNATETVIDASSLNSGMYFARIDGANGSKTIKLIKE